MGIRGAVKTGGGFWNNVDGELKGVTFTNIPPGKDAEPGEWVYMVPSVHVDGAEGPTTQHLFMGAAERYSFEEGGSEIGGADGGSFSVGATTPAGKFINSLLDANPELDIEGALPDVEAGEPLSFDAINGARLRLKQEVDAEGTRKQGKRKVKGKDGKTKEYDRTNTVVVTVYSLGGGKKSAAAKGKGGAAKGETLLDAADKAVIALCEAARKDDKKNKTGEIPASKLSVGIIRLLSGDKNREAVKKTVMASGYLADAAERGIIVYNEEEETVALPA